MMETVMKVENNVACQLKGYHPLTDSHICASPVLTGSMDCQVYVIVESKILKN